MSEQAKEYEGWAILELMGHRRLIGYLREVTIAGAAFLRIDVLTAEGQSTQYYGAPSVYAITPTTEETARRAATLSKVAPVSAWELPEPKRTAPAHLEDTLDYSEQRRTEEAWEANSTGYDDDGD
jgi:hypothetical protein